VDLQSSGSAGRERPRGASLHQLLVSRRIGGAAFIGMRLARAGARRGWPGTTWVPGPGPAADAAAREGLAHRVIELEATDTRRRARLFTCGRLFGTLVGEAQPIVHVHNGFMWGLVRPALIAAGARTVVHFHLDPSEAEIAWTLKRSPTHIVTCARYIAAQVEAVAKAHAVDVPVIAVPNAVDVDRFQPGDRLAARRRIGAGTPESFVVLMLANLAPHKGQATALRALHRMRLQGMQAECWLAGEDRAGRGDHLRTLQALAADLGVSDHVRFLGFRDDAADLLRAADAVVLPSTHEGLPLSLLEAQAARVPVVASDVPGVLEIIEDGRTGFVIPADDAEGYAHRLMLLARQPEIRERVTVAAADHVTREHSWVTFEDRMFDVYRTVATQHGAS